MLYLIHFVNQVKLVKEYRVEGEAPVLRVGQPLRIHNEILPYSADIIGKKYGEGVERLQHLYHSKSVVASTCLGINHPAISGRTFDYCIFDEAGIKFLENLNYLELRF